MVSKIRVGILFGGQSAEHEISLISAKSVINALPSKYEPVLIGIDKTGKWLHVKTLSECSSDPKEICIPSENTGIVIDIGKKKNGIMTNTEKNICHDIDVLFPVLHGTNGEDGTMQGLLELMEIPFVGPSTLGSAVGMDKDICKRLLRDAGIAVSDWHTLRSTEEINYESLEKELKYPMFVKPANAGSSVGVSKAKERNGLKEAIKHAFAFDNKILIEQCIEGREIECAVLGNFENMKASLAGEVIPHHEFYSYEAKYLDENGAGLEIPANISEETLKKIQEIAVKTCKVLECEGMARVDFFLTKEGKCIINEINTIPGFTNISMYPKLWEASGIPYSELLDKLIQLGTERYERKRNKRDY